MLGAASAVFGVILLFTGFFFLRLAVHCSFSFVGEWWLLCRDHGKRAEIEGEK